MPFIEIITSSESKQQLSNFITKVLVNNCDTMFISKENILNIKNIKLDTLVINEKITNYDIFQKIISNSKNLVFNLDENENILENFNGENMVISYGFNSNSDITISSIKDDEIMCYLQKTIKNLQNIIIEPQEIKVKIKRENVDIYDIMIVIALAILYAKK